MTRHAGGRKAKNRSDTGWAATRQKRQIFVFACGHRERFANLPGQFTEEFIEKLAAACLCRNCQSLADRDEGWFNTCPSRRRS